GQLVQMLGHGTGFRRAFAGRRHQQRALDRIPDGDQVANGRTVLTLLPPPSVLPTIRCARPLSSRSPCSPERRSLCPVTPRAGTPAADRPSANRVRNGNPPRSPAPS